MNKSILHSYLNSYFPKLSLRSPLFYNAEIGIRFQLETSKVEIGTPDYFRNVLLRAVMLFEEIFEKDSDIILVVKRFKRVESHISNQGIDLFERYIKNKDLLKRVNCVEIEKVYDNEDELEGIYYQYELQCKTDDIDYKGIIMATAHRDFVIDPIIYDDVFFINMDKHIIFFMYDDRGLDIVSRDKESLRDIYKTYNQWILDYDRDKIDRIFKGLS